MTHIRTIVLQEAIKVTDDDSEYFVLDSLQVIDLVFRVGHRMDIPADIQDRFIAALPPCDLTIDSFCTHLEKFLGEPAHENTLLS